MKRGLLWKEWRQNAWLLLTFLVIIVGLSINDASNSITYHNDSVAYYQSEEFINNQKESDTRLTAAEVKSRLTLNTFDTSNYIGLAYIFCLVIGLKLTVFEKNKRMDYITQAMPYSKRTLIAHKFIWPLLTLISGMFVSAVIYYSLIASNIPSSYLYSLSSYVHFLLANLVTCVTILTFALMMGALIGDAIVATLTTVALLLSANFLFISNLEYTLTALISHFNGKPKNASSTLLDSLFSLESSLSILFMLGIALVFSGLAIYFYSRASLENNGLFLMLPRARLPILILGTLYTACCFATIPYQNIAKPTLLTSYLSSFTLIAAITFSIGWILFYKVKKLRRI